MAQTKWVETSFTADTNAYADLDSLGTRLTFDDDILAKPSVVITDIVISSPDTQNPGIDIYLFDTTISASSTLTDNDALSIAAADRANIFHAEHMTNSFADAVGISYVKSGLNIPVRPTVAHKIFGSLQARGAITYAASSTITVRLGIVEL